MSPHRNPLVVFSLLPFLLLSSSRAVSVHTTVYLDGSVRRELQADFLEDRRRNVLPELKSALPIADREGSTRVADVQRATRSVILAKAEDIDGASVDFRNIVETPLSLFTIYTWKETLKVPADTATAIEKAGRVQAEFKYKLVMPGKILEAKAVAQAAPLEPAPSATPASAVPASEAPPPEAWLPETPPVPATEFPPAPFEPPAESTPPDLAGPEATIPPAPTEVPPVAAPAEVPSAPALEPTPAMAGSVRPEVLGATAFFTLTAEHDQYEITATSRRLRWGYVLTLLYILAFIVYRIAAFLVHQASMKPKRI